MIGFLVGFFHIPTLHIVLCLYVSNIEKCNKYAVI